MEALPDLASLSDAELKDLIHKLEGTQKTVTCSACDTVTFGTVSDCGAQMPFGLPALEPADIKTIHDWIDQGAKDN